MATTAPQPTGSFLTEEAIEYLESHLSHDPLVCPKFFVGVDVGGTNARVALSFKVRGDFTKPVTISKFKASSVEKLKEGLFAIGQEVYHRNGNRVSSGGCVAVAGRSLDNGAAVEITNYTGENRILCKKDLPDTLFPPNNVCFLNDLESASYGIMALNSLGILGEYFKPLWPKEAVTGIHGSPAVVIAAGTGLGVAVLHLPKRSAHYEVMPLEFGHIQMGAFGPSDAEYEQDEKLRQFLSNKLYQGKFAPEIEDVCSGRGIGYVYEFLTGQESVDAAEISNRANQGEDNALLAIDIHYRWQVRCAQNLSVGFVAKSVFLAGDNQVHNLSLVEKNVDRLQQLYVNHPKKHWIQGVPIYVQYKTFNINLLGASYFTHAFS